ncbi:MAG: DUF885 domain-containing protein [Clostridia bacterium]|nr:DUF885 domain-containing protein [Clostridia bacterium]
MKAIKKLFTILLSFCLLFVFTACHFGGNSSSSGGQTPPDASPQIFWHEGDRAENEKFTAFTARVFREAYQNDMLSLHRVVKDLDQYGITRPAMDLFATSSLNFEQTLEELSEMNYNLLSRENQLTYRIMHEDLNDALNDDTPNLMSYFDYSSGIQTNLITLATEYEFFVRQDIEDYLDMIEQMPAYFEYLYEWEEVRVADGYGMSDALLVEVQGQFAQVYGEGEDSCFITSFNEKIDAFEGLTATERAEYKAQNRNLVLNGLFPAYEQTEQKLSAFEGRGNQNGALCSYEGGEEYYETLFKAQTSCGAPIDEMYVQLQSFISAHVFVLSLLAQFNPNEYQAWLQGEAQPMTDVTQILDQFSTRLTEQFPAIENTTYTVKYLSESIANTMPSVLAYYKVPPIDNYTEGAITVNGFSTDEKNLMNTLAHEGYPGHLYQNVYFLSNNPDPVRQLFSFLGYTEGWAVYASNCAETMYEYPKYDVAFTQLNQSNTSFSYALYAMADIAVHYYGMDAEDLMTFSPYWAPDLEMATAVYESVLKMPGVYLSYGVGNMLMDTLRAYAYGREGDNFDPVDFHRFVLDMGPCSFDLLQEWLEEYYDIKLNENSSQGS